MQNNENVVSGNVLELGKIIGEPETKEERFEREWKEAVKERRLKEMTQTELGKMKNATDQQLMEVMIELENVGRLSVHVADIVTMMLSEGNHLDCAIQTHNTLYEILGFDAKMSMDQDGVITVPEGFKDRGKAALMHNLIFAAYQIGRGD